MTSDVKFSMALGAEYLGITEEALKSLHEARIIQECAWVGEIPLFLKSELFRVKDLRRAPLDPLQADIRVRRTILVNSIAASQAKLTALQEECTHPHAMKENKANTGNYDPSQNCYWRDCQCPDCGRRWMEDQ